MTITPYVRAVPFGIKGASWFCVVDDQPHKDGRKLTGYRWQPLGIYGRWRPPVSVVLPAGWAKQPGCPRPAEPTAERRAELDAIAANQRGDAAAARKAAQSLEVGTRVTFPFNHWDRETGRTSARIGTGTVHAHKGRYVIVKSPDLPPMWQHNGQFLPHELTRADG